MRTLRNQRTAAQAASFQFVIVAGAWLFVGALTLMPFVMAATILGGDTWRSPHAMGRIATTLWGAWAICSIWGGLEAPKLHGFIRDRLPVLEDAGIWGIVLLALLNGTLVFVLMGTGK